MITEAEYNQWKPLIEEYEEYLFQQATLEALYCVECQALEAHDCWCDKKEPGFCDWCQLYDNNHYMDCPYVDPEEKC